MSDLKRLESQLEQLERSYKLGIISEDEYQKGKKNLEEKIQPLREEQKKTEESKKIINEVLSDKEEKPKKETKKTSEKKSKKKTAEKDTGKQEPKQKSAAKKETSKPDKKAETQKPSGRTSKATKEKKTPDTKKTKTRETEEVPEKESKGSIWAGIVIILIVVGAFLMFGGPSEEVDTTVNPKNLTGVNETLNIFYYSSYSCEYCQTTNEILENIDKAYGDNVQVIRNHYPYNLELDYEMDIASECAAKQGMYDNYSRMLYNEDKPVKTDRLVAMAEELGLNTTRFQTCLEDNETAKDVLENYEGAIAMEMKKIPAVNIDGATITGVKPAIIYETIINDSLGIN